MRKQNTKIKKNFLKKIFIKICRIFGYEIIDQSNFYVPTQEKKLNENLNIQGKKSITLPLGETKISRKVNALTVIFRSCTSVNMLTQNKKRLFDQNKSEYTFRSLNSIIKSLNKAKLLLPKIKFDIIVIDHNSESNDLKQIKKQLDKSNLPNSIISLNVNEFVNNIKNINSKKQEVTKNQISNMSNIHKSLLVAKDRCNDLIYFVEDDYLHQLDSIYEMVSTYERISSQMNRELFICPTDYPYLYSKIENTNIFLGSNKHWRKVEETLCTFLTSKIILEKYWERFVLMCQFEHDPFEQPLHDIYKLEYCLSPIPSLALHCTNINSIFGLSPNIDWEKIWEENKNF
ncbi:MAG: glycosyltransferase family 2 protein [Candidatus Pelagibacterales bacterium]|nr:MAG: glycosyltransferase family 2 protein [Pelagibacterales bacterium]